MVGTCGAGSDYGYFGQARTDTGSSGYTSYMPSGWMHRDGLVVNDRVEYTAVPVYTNLEWSQCNQACTSRPNTKLDTGVHSTHGIESSFYGRTYAGKGPCICSCSNTTVNDTEFPCPQRSTVCVDGKCYGARCTCSSGGYQRLCAERLGASSCETIGRGYAEDALVAAWDATGARQLGTRQMPVGQLTTAQPGFENVHGVKFGTAICSYAPDSIETPADLKAFKDKQALGRLPSNAAFEGPLMQSFCTRMATGKCSRAYDAVPGRCTQLMEDSDAGMACRNWFKDLWNKRADKTLPVTYDAVVHGICSAYPDLKECECNNRNADETFKILKEEVTGSPQCWWTPCRDGTDHGMLLDEAIQSREDDGCRTFNCTNLVKIVNSHYNDVDLDKLTSSCGEMGGGAPGDAINTTPALGGPGVTESAENTLSSWVTSVEESTGMSAITVGAIVFAVVVLLAMAAMVATSGRNK